MRELRCAGDWQYDRAAREYPGKGNLARGRAVAPGDRVQHRARPGEVAGRQRKPGYEPDPVPLAVDQHVLAVANDQVVAVLNRGHLEEFGGGFDLGHRDFAQPGVTDHTIAKQRLDGIKLLITRHLRIDAVQLPQPDLLDAELATALLGLLDQVFGPAQRYPLIGPGARQSALGGHEQIAIGVQRFANEPLRYIRPIGIGRIDEVHAERG